MSCDRRRAGFLAHVLAAVPDGTGKPTVNELDQVFRDACVPPRSAAERITNEAKARALFQAFDQAGFERPTHSQTRMPATDSLCAGYAKLYDDLRARNVLAGQTRRAETRDSAPGPVLAQVAQQPRPDRTDKIKIQLDGTTLEVTGGRFGDMLAVIKSLPGSWFHGSTKTWVVKVDQERLDQAMRARGYSVNTPGVNSAIAAGLVAPAAPAAPAPAPAPPPMRPQTPQERASAFLDDVPGVIAIANGATGSDDDHAALIALAEAWRVDPGLSYGQQLQASRLAHAPEDPAARRIFAAVILHQAGLTPCPECKRYTSPKTVHECPAQTIRASAAQSTRDLLARVPALIDVANDDQRLTRQSAAFEALSRSAQDILRREADTPGVLDDALVSNARSFVSYAQTSSDAATVAAWSKHFATAICVHAETPKCDSCGQWQGDDHVCPEKRFDQDGYNKYGYNRRGYNREGFDRSGRDREGYDRNGYNRDSYNRRGFAYSGFDHNSRHPSGYTFATLGSQWPVAPDGTDLRGYDRAGYDRAGYDSYGYNRDGYDRQGYDRSGRDRSGDLHPDWRPDTDGFYPDGLNEHGADREGYMPTGRDPWGYDRQGYDGSGFDRNGWHRDGYDRNGYFANGFHRSANRDKAGYDIAGYDTSGFNRDGYSFTGYDKSGRDRSGQPRMMRDRKGQLVEPKYNQSGWDKDGYDRWGYHHETGLTAPDADGRQYDIRGWVYDPATPEVYDPADPARRMAHGGQFYWQGRRGYPGRVIPSYQLPSPALAAPPPPPVIDPFTPPSGGKLPSSTAQQRWATARAQFDELATSSGIRLKCPKCGQFTGGGMHQCPAFGNQAVAVWASGAITTDTSNIRPDEIVFSPNNPAYDGRYRFEGYSAPNGGFDPDGHDRQGYDARGYDRQGYNREGYDALGFDRDGYDRQGYNRDGKDREGQSRPRTLQEAARGLEPGADPLDNEIMAKYLGSVASALTQHPCKVVLRRGRTIADARGVQHYISGGFATDMKGTIYADPYPLGPDADARSNLIVAKAGIYHEIGHELTTDPAHWAYIVGVAEGNIEAEGIDKGRHLVPRIYNIIEDGRMEREISKTPGVAATLAASCRVSPRWDERVGDGVPTGHQVQGALLYTALPYFRVRPDLIDSMTPGAREVFEELAPIVRRGALGSNEDALNATLEVVRRLEARGVFDQDENLNVTPPPPPPPGTEAKGPANPPPAQGDGSQNGQQPNAGRQRRQSQEDDQPGSGGQQRRGSGQPDDDESTSTGRQRGGQGQDDEDDGIDRRKNRPRKADDEETGGAGRRHGSGAEDDDESTGQARRGAAADDEDDKAGSGRRSGQAGEDDEPATSRRRGQDDDESTDGQQRGQGDEEGAPGGGRYREQDDDEASERGQAGAGSAGDDEEAAEGGDQQAGGASDSQGEQGGQQQGGGAGAGGAESDDEPGAQAGSGAGAQTSASSDQAGQDGGAGAGAGSWDDPDDGWGDPNAGNQAQAGGASQDAGDSGGEGDRDESTPLAPPDSGGSVGGAHDSNAGKVDVTEDIGASQSAPYDAASQVANAEILDDPARVFSDAEIEAILDRAEREAADAIDAGVRRNTTFESLGQRLHAPLPRDTERMTQRYRTPTGAVSDVDVGLSRTNDPKLLTTLKARMPELRKVAGQLSRQIDYIREQAEERVRMQTQGRLDRRRYVAAVKGAETVRKRTEEQPATSMAISMTLDFSGSMGGDIRSGRLHDAAMVLSAAFDELDMPYEVRGHGDSATQYKALDDGHFEPERSAMLTVDNLAGNGCTAPVMGLGANALMARDETNKLAVSMTDGELYDHAETCRQLAEARRNGIVTFGVYVSRGRPPDNNKMNELYGKGNWTIVQDIKDMPRAVGKRLLEVFESLG